MSQALICPQCSAPLSPSRFARSVTCAYCGTTIQLDPSHVPAARFHEAYQIWNSPQTHGYSSWLSLDEDHWAIEHLLGQGDTADVYAGRRARWPTEVVVLKVARDAAQEPRAGKRVACILQSLQQSTAPGAEVFGRLLPQPVMHGQVTAGLFSGPHGQRLSPPVWLAAFAPGGDATVPSRNPPSFGDLALAARA
jgi:hypothetical protein